MTQESALTISLDCRPAGPDLSHLEPIVRPTSQFQYASLDVIGEELDVDGT